jgi:hypothetical protein
MAVPFLHHHLFEINDNLKIQETSVGDFMYLYIDNFYKRPDDIYAMFEESWILNWKLDYKGRNFKDYFDCRSFIPLNNHGFPNENKTIEWLKDKLKLAELDCSRIATNVFTWINTPRSKNIQFCPHQDPTYNILVYLDKINSGGTALYKKVPEGIPSEYQDIQYDISSIKEDMQVIPSVFNRCVIFNGNIPHGGYIEDHSKYSNGNWRYNTVYFFNKHNSK